MKPFYLNPVKEFFLGNCSLKNYQKISLNVALNKNLLLIM